MMLSSQYLIIITIVVLFIGLCFIYNRNSLLDSTLETAIDENTELLDMMNQAKIQAKLKIQEHIKNSIKHNRNNIQNKNLTERFNPLIDTLTEEEAAQYVIQINFLSDWLKNNSNDKGLSADINQLVKQANDQRLTDRNLLINILSNMYALSYIDMLNRQNAEAYKVYSKYKDPRNNKYYTQYLSS